MAKIPESGPFWFSDIRAQFGVVVEGLGRDKNLFSSYLGIAGAPTEAPLLGTDFRGRAAELVLRASEFTGSVSSNVAQMFHSHYGQATVDEYSSFKYIQDIPRVIPLYSGKISPSVVGSISQFYEVYLGRWGWSAGTELTIQLRAGMTGAHHGNSPASANGISWVETIAGSTPAHKLTATSNKFATKTSVQLGTKPTSALFVERSLTLDRVNGTIVGGDSKGGDIRIAYAEIHGEKLTSKSWISGDGKGGSGYWVDTNPTYGLTRAEAYALLPGKRTGHDNLPIVTTAYSAVVGRMMSSITLYRHGSDTGVAGIKHLGTIYEAAVARGPVTQQSGLGKSWIRNGKSGGSDALFSMFDHYYETDNNRGTTPSYTLGALQFRRKYFTKTGSNPAGAPGITVVNDSVLTITGV